MAEFLAWCVVLMIGFVCLSIFVFMMTGKSLLWRVSQLPNINTAEQWLFYKNRECSNAWKLVDKIHADAKNGKYPPTSDHGEPMYWREYFIENTNPIVRMEVDPKDDGGIHFQFYGYSQDGVEYSLTDWQDHGDLLLYYVSRDKDLKEIRKWIIKSDEEAQEIERRQRS